MKVRHSGQWKEAESFVRQSGQWQPATPWCRDSGQWHEFPSGGIDEYTMTVGTVSPGNRYYIYYGYDKRDNFGFITPVDVGHALKGVVIGCHVSIVAETGKINNTWFEVSGKEDVGKTVTVTMNDISHTIELEDLIFYETCVTLISFEDVWNLKYSVGQTLTMIIER